jgi:hypothetical protein
MDKEDLNSGMEESLMEIVKRIDELMVMNDLDYVVEVGTAAAWAILSIAEDHIEAGNLRNKSVMDYHQKDQVAKDWDSLHILMANLTDILREAKQKGHLKKTLPKP